jgi:hypothetical protein
MIYFRGMKQTLLTTALLIATVLAFAQAPQGINQQTAITDSDGEAIDYLSDSTIKTCEEFISAQTQMYKELEIITKTIMRDAASRTSPAGKEAYERAVNLKTRSAVLQKTKISLRNKGVIDLDCANKISELELSWAALMAELNGGKIDPSDLEKAKKATNIMNGIGDCMKTCQEKHMSNQEAMVNCMKVCSEEAKKKMVD